MRTEHVDFQCASCGLAIRADESPDGAEAEERFERVFWCAHEKHAFVLDAEADGFRGRCPECGATLVLLHFPLAACPACLAPMRQRRAYTGPL